MRNYSKVGSKPGKPGYRSPSSFRALVFEQVKKIPNGQTRTYKQIATQIGHPKAYRAVGSALSHNYDPSIPCHRVIRSDGLAGEYNRGKDKKIEKLRSEGCAIIFP